MSNLPSQARTEELLRKLREAEPLSAGDRLLAMRYIRRVNDYVQENQRLSERLEQQWAENGRLRAALTEIRNLDHYPDATIARKALDDPLCAKTGIPDQIAQR
jgi:benzoyl-CoA reductase/2-hydroxyglutaryl-CoA dehydratase subunit BcrC/BadD/HgdB